MIEETQLFADLESVEIGQLDVEKNEVGLELTSKLKSLGRVLGLADDLVSLGLQERSRAGPKAGVVVDDENCHTHSLAARVGKPNTVTHTLFKRRP